MQPREEPILMEDGTPAVGAAGTPYLLVRQSHGRFAVSQGRHYCIDNTTKTRCIQWTRDAVNGRLAREAAEAADRARLLAHLEQRGITELDYRKVQPGDLFATHPYGDLRTVTGVTHNDNGSSVITCERKRSDPPGSGVALMIPQYPACYGRHHEGALS